jgi:hypothetical protein
MGLIAMTLAPVAADGHQRAHQAWVIACRIAADDENEIRLLDVLELYCARAAADRAIEPDAARLVAVVTAVVDVVRAV